MPEPFYRSPSGDVVLWQGDARATLAALPAGSVHTCITSPPYWQLRNYDADGQLGLEATVEGYVDNLVAVFREVRRVLHPTGTVWLNLGDSYNAYNGNAGQGGPVGLTQSVQRPKLPAGNGLTSREAKAKDLLMIPSRVAIALRDDGWWLRAMIPWLKRNAMPESAQDRPTTAAEYVFLLSKASTYFYDADATRIRNGREASWEEYAAADGRRHLHEHDAERGMMQRNPGFRAMSHPAGRNRRNADWWFDSLRAVLAGATGLLADEDGEPLALPINPESFPGAHFATFPRRLVEPMLLAGTSARGCCPACEAPWQRVTERESSWPARKAAGGTAGNVGVSATYQNGVHGTRVDHDLGGAVRTTGWRAGCACDAGEPVPAVVLDPFAGACTTGLVARKHGRHFIGVDLSAAYLDMARERLGQLAFDLGGAAWPTTSTSTDTPTGSASSATGDSPSPDGDRAGSGWSTRRDDDDEQLALPLAGG